MNNSIQGGNSLWNIDFSNPTSVATINNGANEVKEDDGSTTSNDFSGRGLGFMSFVYASMGNTDDGTYVPTEGGYVVSDPNYLNSYSEEDLKNFLESNSSNFKTTIDWTEYEEILTSDQIAELSKEYSGDLSLSKFTEAINSIESFKEINAVEGEYVAPTIDAYKLFASSMASALDEYAISCYTLDDSDGISDEAMDFLTTDYYSTGYSSFTGTLSFADHFESMLDDLMENTSMDISGLLAVLDGLRAQETSFALSDILAQVDNDTISNLIKFSSSIA